MSKGKESDPDLPEKDKIDLLTKFDRVQEFGRIGYWEYDVYAQSIWWSKNMYRLLNKDLNQGTPSYEEMLLDYDEESRAILDKSVRDALTDFKNYELELKTSSRIGPVKNIRATGVVEKTDDKFTLFGMIQDITPQITAENALRASKDRITNIANGVPGTLLVYKVDPQGKQSLVYISNQVEKLYEIPRAEAETNLQLLWDCCVPEYVELLQQDITRSLESLENFESTFKIKTPSGKVKWIRGAGQPRRLEDGSTIWDTLLMDVTVSEENRKELKKMIGENDRLFKELHHRIKNNLQMVSSMMQIASFSRNNSEFTDFINDTITRINSIAKTHERLLHLRSFDELYTKNYLEDLVCDAIATMCYNPDLFQLTTDIDDALMHMDELIPIGLIVNEVVSNSIKHAYDPEEGGEIHILFKELKSHYQLQLEDFGKGKNQSFNTNDDSVGLILINQFTAQLKAEWTIDHKTGTKYTIKIPRRV